MENEKLVFNHTFYIVMNKECPDLNPGKAIAQGAHTQSVMSEGMRSGAFKHEKQWKEWLGDWDFGRTLTLEATPLEITELIDLANQLEEPYAYVFDPTYPVRNYYGHRYTIEQMTGASFFIPDGDEDGPWLMRSKIKKLKLHP